MVQLFGLKLIICVLITSFFLSLDIPFTHHGGSYRSSWINHQLVACEKERESGKHPKIVVIPHCLHIVFSSKIQTIFQHRNSTRQTKSVTDICAQHFRDAKFMFHAKLLHCIQNIFHVRLPKRLFTRVNNVSMKIMKITAEMPVGIPQF